MKYLVNKTLSQKIKKDAPVIGITGGIGSGKSAVTDCIGKFGIDVVDADIVAREVVLPGSLGLAGIVEHFGQTILNEKGELNRAVLRTKIFENNDEKLWLEALLHPLIAQSINAQLHESSTPYAVLSSPLLFETNQHSFVDSSVLVDTSVALQMERVTARDNNSKELVQSIIAAQMPREEKQKMADWMIDNSGSLETLTSSVEELHREICTFYGVEK